MENGKETAKLPVSKTRLYVDVAAIKYNYEQIKKHTGDNITLLPMVKANAYGCGAEVIARVFKDCEYLAVADVNEALIIRKLAPKAKIVIIYQPCYEDCDEIVENGYVTALSDIIFAEKLNEAAKKHGKTAKIHIEIDTGFGRMGVRYNDCSAFFEALQNLPTLKTEGIFTHYSSADEFDDEAIAFTKIQTERFLNCIKKAEEALGKIKFIHAANSAAVFSPICAKYTESFNMARPGYMLYGYYPCEKLKSVVKLKPALRLASDILQIREIEEGEHVGYGREFTANEKRKIATVAIGYSDGLPRRLFSPQKNKNGAFVVNGQLAPIAGRISMDLTTIDITDISGEIKVGDEATIFDSTSVTVEDIAGKCGTIGYEIIANIQGCVDRIEI